MIIMKICWCRVAYNFVYFCMFDTWAVNSGIFSVNMGCFNLPICVAICVCQSELLLYFQTPFHNPSSSERLQTKQTTSSAASSHSGTNTWDRYISKTGNEERCSYRFQCPLHSRWIAIPHEIPLSATVPRPNGFPSLHFYSMCPLSTLTYSISSLLDQV